MLKDLIHGARTLMRDKGWTAVVVLSLALGIGANTALFSAVNSLFLKKLEVRDPDTLVRLKWAGKNDMVTDSSDYGYSAKNTGDQTVRATFSFPMFQQFVADNTTMDDLVAFAPYSRVNLVVDGQADIASSFISTGNYYRMLGLHANPGRTITPGDDRPDAAPVAVISARYWRSRFGGDPGAVGKIVQMNNVPVTIVGVMTPDLIDVQQAVREGPDIAFPLALDSQLDMAGAGLLPGEPPRSPRLQQPTWWWLQVMGRVKPGVTAAQVQANLESVFQHTARAGLDTYLASLSAETRGDSRNRNRTEVPRLRVDSASRGVYDVNVSDSSAVTILSVVVVLILLIVCANVANLLLSRAATRHREISIRLSLGATRWRLVRQLLTESLMLAAMGGALGVLVGRWGQQLLPGTAGQAAPLDWRVLSFVLGVTGLTGLVFGIAPALRATGMNVSGALKETSRSVAGSRSLLSKSLLVMQVAISLVLLIAAGLFLRTLQNLRNVDVGFNTRNLVLFRVNPALNRYDERAHRGAVPRHAGAPRRDRRRPLRGAGERAVAVRKRQLDQHLRAGAHLSAGPARLDQPPAHFARVLRDDGDADARWGAPSPIGTTRRRRRSRLSTKRRHASTSRMKTRSASTSGRTSSRPGRSRSSASCATPSTTAFAMRRRRRCTCRTCSGRCRAPSSTCGPPAIRPAPSG